MAGNVDTCPDPGPRSGENQSIGGGNSSKHLIISIDRAPQTFARILAFGAGGAGGVSSLAILRTIMVSSEVEDLAAPASEKLFPCQHFELICGSKWGGIVAVMLGRLWMVCRSSIL